MPLRAISGKRCGARILRRVRPFAGAGERRLRDRNGQRQWWHGFRRQRQLFSEFVRFTRDGYDETGAGGANLSVGDARQTIWNFGISVQAAWTYVMADGGKLKPDVHVSYKYDVMDDRADSTASFFAGGSTIESQGVDPANSVFGIGVGVKFYDVSGWDFTANYDFTFKDAYEAHSAFLRAAYEF